MVFLPSDDALEAQCRAIYERVAGAEGFDVLGWRDVPVDTSAVGPIALGTMPRIRQVFLSSRDKALQGAELERELFIVRKLVEQAKVRETQLCRKGGRGVAPLWCSALLCSACGAEEAAGQPPREGARG